jgi:hypothetical protein
MCEVIVSYTEEQGLTGPVKSRKVEKDQEKQIIEFVEVSNEFVTTLKNACEQDLI